MAADEFKLLRRATAAQDQARFVVFFNESLYCCEGCSKQLLNLVRRAVSRMNPDEFRWSSQENTARFKVGIFGDDGQALLFGIFPNSFVGGATETTLVNM